MMNIAMPSIVIKMMRHKFDQQWSVRKTHGSAPEQMRILRVLREASMTLDARLEGPTLKVRDLLELSEGQLLTLEYPAGHSVEMLVNGTHKYAGQVVSTGRKRGYPIETVRPLPPQGRSNEGDAAGGAEPGSSE
jgi:flagellar motor switch protein FliM